MESTELIQFYNHIKHWPKNLAEMNSVVEKVCSLLRASYVAVQFKGPESDFFSLQISPDLQSDLQGDEEGFKKWVQLQFAEKDPGGLKVKLFRLETEGTPLSHRSSPFHLTVGRLGDLGVLLVATESPLRAKEEIVFTAVCEYLRSLSGVDQLEAALALRSQFLSIASHELKTPLTSIYGILQLQQRMLKVKKDEPLAVQLERQQNFLAMVIRQVERLNELIDGLLDVSRIHNGRFMVEPSDTDVATLLRDAANSRLAVIAQEAGVKIHLDAPVSLSAWVDPVRIEEVITNLVMNAIRFSPEGGVVWIKLNDDRGTIRLSIRDQGPSVPLEDQERIFQPFERAQRTGRLGGLGLGLFISREIAQLHGGTVKLVESVAGKGNVFEAELPVRNLHRVSA